MQVCAYHILCGSGLKPHSKRGIPTHRIGVCQWYAARAAHQQHINPFLAACLNIDTRCRNCTNSRNLVVNQVALSIVPTPWTIKSPSTNRRDETWHQKSGKQGRGDRASPMEIATLLLITTAATALKADPSIPEHGAEFTISRLPMVAKPLLMMPLNITDHVVSLRRGESRSVSSYFVQSLRNQAKAVQEGGDSRLGVGLPNITSCRRILTPSLHRTPQPTSYP